MYKVLVLQNTNLDTKKDFLKAKDYLKEKEIDVSFFTKPVNELTSVHEYLKREGYRWDNGKPDTISLLGLDDIVKDNCRKYVKENEYDCVIFVWDKDTLGHPLQGNQVVTSFTNNKPLYKETGFIQLAINQWCIDNNKVWDKITHEMVHELAQKLNNKGCAVLDEMDITSDGRPFYKNDDPYAVDGNYARTFANIKPFINFLYRHPYKWFSVAEVEKFKLHPDLWIILDKAREVAGVPFIITSGFRTPEQNKKVGGKANSSHLKGLGCDLSVVDNYKRYKILKALFSLNEAVFIEIARKHIHIDISVLTHDMEQLITEDDD